MAASTAEPPARSTSLPAAEAKLWGEVTMPRRLRVAGRPVGISKIRLRKALRLTDAVAAVMKSQAAHGQQDVAQAGQQIDDGALTFGLRMLHIGVIQGRAGL